MTVRTVQQQLPDRLPIKYPYHCQNSLQQAYLPSFHSMFQTNFYGAESDSHGLRNTPLKKIINKHYH